MIIILYPKKFLPRQKRFFLRECLLFEKCFKGKCASMGAFCFAPSMMQLWRILIGCWRRYREFKIRPTTLNILFLTTTEKKNKSNDMVPSLFHLPPPNRRRLAPSFRRRRSRLWGSLPSLFPSESCTAETNELEPVRSNNPYKPNEQLRFDRQKSFGDGEGGRFLFSLGLFAAPNTELS